MSLQGDALEAEIARLERENERLRTALEERRHYVTSQSADGDPVGHDGWECDPDCDACAFAREVARLRDGLRFYAKQRGLGAVLASDGGKIARALLAEEKPSADDEAIARTVRYRDTWDDGKRLTIKELEDSIEDGAA